MSFHIQTDKETSRLLRNPDKSSPSIVNRFAMTATRGDITKVDDITRCIRIPLRCMLTSRCRAIIRAQYVPIYEALK